MKGLSYLSKIEGMGGNIGNDPEDFIVEEIPSDGKRLGESYEGTANTSNGAYSIFILKKKMWSTQDALKAIADSVGVTRRRMSAAGNKDRNAITVQLASCWGIEPEKINQIRIKDIEILGCWRSKTPVAMGDLIGNRFEIRIKEIERFSQLKKIDKDLDGLVPNYFGPQRFGMRGNNHIVGKLLVKGRLKEAVLEFVAGGQDKSEEGKRARLAVIEGGINPDSLDKFPKRLGHERTIIRHLINKPDDYVGALRDLPKDLQLMFVQSYQSYLFNKMLSDHIRKGKLIQKEGEVLCGLNAYGFIDPSINGSEAVLGRIIGYDTKPTEEEENLLWNEGIETANFRVRGLPELSVGGSLRPLLTNIKKLKVSKEENDSCVLNFELPKGSYATSALREFIDRRK